MNMMRQEVMENPKNVVIRDVPVPEPGKGQVLVKIMKIGICGSDIHVYHGTHPFTSYPITQGHEVAGVLVQNGEGAGKFKVGQKVTIEPQIYCGECYPCRHGKYNLCENLRVMGFQATGTASQYFVVEESKLTALPETMSYAQGAMLEPLAVAVHASKRFTELQGAHVAVIGAGPIGILVGQAAKALGAKKVMITDISDKRLAIAEGCGLDVPVNTKNIDFGEALVKTFGPDKADVIYDCAGNDVSIGQAIKYARKGSTIILVAVFGKMAHVDLAVLNDHELDLNTSMMYRHEDFVDAIRFVEEGKVKLEPLMTNTFGFEDYGKAYEFIDANREEAMKVLITVNPEA